MSSLAALRLAKKQRTQEKLAAAREAKAKLNSACVNSVEQEKADDSTICQVSSSISSSPSNLSTCATSTSSTRETVLCDAFVGRRIVELGTLKERVLEGCEACGENLDIFNNCVGERVVGLASELEVMCSRCGCSNTVATSKSHRCSKRSRSEVEASSEELQANKRTRSHAGGKIYDVNTKAALGKSLYSPCSLSLHMSHLKMIENFQVA